MTTTRRTFLAAAPAAALAQRSPNDRIRLGLIGAGGRGTYLAGEVRKSGENAEIVHVCDVWRPARERASAMIEKEWGAKPRLCSRYQDLLADPAVDAVIISAPDHTHARILTAAVHAGKDAYCEKPMGTILDEAREAYLAVKKSGRVVQIGTQRRSEPGLIGAARMIQRGVIGKVTRADMQVHFQEPRWRRDYNMVKPEDLDWQAFDFGRNIGPFDPRKFREWQLFQPLSNGIPGLWMSHLIDLAAWFLDDPYPRATVALGGVYLWKDGRQTSDVFSALLEYPKDCLVQFSMSLTNSAGSRNLWFGTLGTFDADALKFLTQGSRDPKRLMEDLPVEKVGAESHMANFLRCVRTRLRPRADIQAGFSHAVADCMAVESLRSGRRVGFDPGKLEMT
jgi:predicted dehydrogenase